MGQKHIAKAYASVRDATVENEDISNAEKIALLEQVKFEILQFNHGEIHGDEE